MSEMSIIGEITMLFPKNVKEILNRNSIIETDNIIFKRDGFNLLESIRNNDDTINLKEIINIDKSHNQLFPKKIKDQIVIINSENDYINELKNKNNFFKDSFFNQILSNEESKMSFENINSNKNFETKFKMDMNNSSKYFFCGILKEMNQICKLKELQEKIKNQEKSLSPLEKENKSLISEAYKVPNEIKEINYYKKVKPNGDSFYISFIYQYVRNLIPEGNGEIISRIINLQQEYQILNPASEAIKDPSKFGENYIEKTGSNNFEDLKNLQQTFSYLGIIYNLITVENDIENAIKMFDFVFSLDKILWKVLCLFMKYHINQFLRKNRDKFNMNEYYIKNKLIPEKYFSRQNKEFDYDSYINDNISINQMEPSLFIISIVPYVFNVKLNLFINEEGSEPDDINELFKIEINPNKNDDYYINEINILYSLHSYHIILTQLDEININEDNYIKYVQRENCKICYQNQYIILKRIVKDYPICFNCFKSMIDQILIKRYKNMIKEKFNFVEYYLKEIPLIENDSGGCVNLSQNEFFYIFHQNLFTYFRKLIDKICDLCGKLNKKIIHKICGCKYCIECAKRECKIIFFNNFEKNFVYKNKKIKCKCGKEIEIINYASQIYNMLNIQEKIFYEEEIENRIKKYIDNYCMICGKENNKNLISKNLKKKYKIFRTSFL